MLSYLFKTKKLVMTLSLLGLTTYSSMIFAESHSHEHHHDNNIVIGTIKRVNHSNDLPLLENLKQAIQNRLDFQVARNQLDQANIEKERYNGDNYEYNVSWNESRRKIRSLGANQREWEIGINKTIRLPHKSNLDDDAGSQTVAKAQVAVEDHVHESLRLLLKLWFNYAKELAQKDQWIQQVKLLKEQHQVSERRVKGGHAPKLEAMLAFASYSQAKSQLSQAELKVKNAYTELHKEFKLLKIPQNLVVSTPKQLELPDQYFLDLMLHSSHELKLAKEEAKLAQVLAKRTSSEKLPDPTFGLTYSSESLGDERVLGVSISMPIPNDTRRKFDPAMATKVAESSALKEAIALRKVEKDAKILIDSVRANYNSWKEAQTVAQTMQKNADLLAKAYSLGEADLMDTLSARKQSVESNLSATLAQIEAQESYYKLLLDSHLLWDIESFLK